MNLSKRFAGLSLAFVAALTISVGVRADSTEQLREQVLALNLLTGSKAQDGKATLLLRDIKKSKQLVEVAAEMIEDKDGDEYPFNFNANLVLAQLARAVEMPEVGDKFYRVAIDQAGKLRSSLKLIRAYDGLIESNIGSGNYAEAAKICQEFLERDDPQLNRAKTLMMERLIQAKALDGKTEEALKLAEGMAELDEGGWYFLRLKAFALQQAGKLDDAVKAYMEVISRLRTADIDKDQKQYYTARARYALSGVFVDLKQIDKAAEQLQVLLKENPKNPTYYNDLGFIWADHDMNLEEAEKMIRKALELDEIDRKAMNLPEELDKPNAAYLDSLGWVLFRKGDYKGARKYLEEAVSQEEGRHIEIMDHLAEALIKLGEVDEAIKIWEDALTVKDVSPRDKELRQRVKEKLEKYRQID